MPDSTPDERTAMSENRQHPGARTRVRARYARSSARRALAGAVGLATATLALSCAAGERDAGAEGGTAPDTFTVVFETSTGEVAVEFVRAWSPVAVDRVHELAAMGFWRGSRIYRVNERYAQFGYSGRPALDSVWVPDGLPDEPTRASNVRGSVSFARGGPGTRSTILFVNRSDNTNLDHLSWNGVEGFPPVGRVVRGMDAIDSLYSGYGDGVMEWEDSIAALGNPFLDRSHPRLDSITDVRIVPDDD